MVLSFVELNKQENLKFDWLFTGHLIVLVFCYLFNLISCLFRATHVAAIVNNARLPTVLLASSVFVGNGLLLHQRTKVSNFHHHNFHYKENIYHAQVFCVLS